MRLMKIKGICVLLLMLSIYPVTHLVHAGQPVTPQILAPTVVLDGVSMSFDVDPIIIKGSTLVPMRAIFEALGAMITKWDSTTQTVTAQKNQTDFIYTIGDTYAIINGWKVDIASSPGMTKDYRTLVPLRMVSESLGATVHYDGLTKVITIQSKPSLTNQMESVSSLMRYRMTLPYSTILQDAPYQIAYLRAHVDENAFVFFGDSITWGSYLGRKEAHPYLISLASGRNSFNMGVPGFNLNQMLPFMMYALQDKVEPNVVVQLQYFWGDSSSEQYSGLADVIEGVLPDYTAALAQIRKDIVIDDDTTTSRPYANYVEQSPILREATQDRGKQIFTTRTVLDQNLLNSLNALNEFVATRPDQAFYVYIPPYQMNEVFEHTMLTSEQFTAYIDQISAIFADSPNVRFKDFNATSEQWMATDYIDWIHRSVAGEKKLAGMMQQWLLED